MTFNRNSLLTGIEILVRTVIHSFEHLEQRK
jgi:amidohydrolase